MSQAIVAPAGPYHEVEYMQFRPTGRFRAARAAADFLAVPVVWPLAVVCRRSDALFRTASELLSLVPYALGVVLRGTFYRYALKRCGRNLVVEFGAVFVYPDVSVGDNVLVGRFNVVHHCDLGDYVLIGERCTFLSGSKQHRFDRTDVPMALQGGQRKRIRVGDDCWIGAHAVVADDVGPGSIVGAGSVVLRPVPERTIVAGNPARPLRRRGEATAENGTVVPTSAS